MATRQIKSLKDLPDWFCIDDYKEAETLDARGWHIQLGLRGLCYDYLVPLPLSNAEDKQLSRKFGLYVFKIVQSTAIHKDRERSVFEPRTGDREISPFNSHSVQSLALGDLMIQQESTFQVPTDFYYLRRGISMDGLASVVVDLKATDEQILSDFKHWLAGFRLALGFAAPTKNFTRTQFARWHQHGVLPYLDLLLWSEAEEVSIADHVLGKAIFPEEYDVDLAERIAKTTRKSAMKAIAGPTIQALKAQVVAELLAEQNFQKTLPE